MDGSEDSVPSVLARFVVLLAVALVLTSSDAIAAQRRGARLTWSRGPEAERCVGPTGLEEDVRRRLGWNPFAMSPEITIEGILFKNGAAWEARFSVHDRKGLLGERVLRSRDPSCASLGEAVAVALTVAIDPDAPGTRLPDAIEEPSPGDVGKISPPPPSPPVHQRRGSLSPRAIAAFGLVPGPALGAGFSGGLSLSHRLAIELGAFALPESRRRDFGFSLSALRASICFAPLTGTRGRLEICGELWAGLFSAFLHPSPVLVPSDVGTSPWAGGDLAVGGLLAIAGPVEVIGKASVLTPFTRRQAFVRGRPLPEWEQATLAVTAELGLGVRFDGL